MTPTPISIACSAKLPPMPQIAIVAPPSAGPSICEMVCPAPFNVIAFISRLGGTTAGMSAWRTGCPTATPVPTNSAITKAIRNVIRSIQMRIAVRRAAISTIAWLMKSSRRRSQRSERTPAGSARKKTGMPSAKLTSPR